MKTEFEALYIYLVGDNMYEDFIRKKFEAKFGTKTVSKLESLWIVLYINDTLFAFGKNRNLNSKLLFLAGLIEVSKHNILEILHRHALQRAKYLIQKTRYYW